MIKHPFIVGGWTGRGQYSTPVKGVLIESNKDQSDGPGLTLSLVVTQVTHWFSVAEDGFRRGTM
jgi:hypothetical protein